jgi:hypothetical protein
LREDGLFVTFVPGPRAGVDDVLAGVLACWNQRKNTPGASNEALEYQVVVNRQVHGLVIAAGPGGVERARTVAAGFLTPCTRSLEAPTTARPGLWRTLHGLAAVLGPVVLGRRRAP